VPSAQESFGRVYIEAWASAKPVIGGRIPAVEEVITDGENGLLVEPGSAGQLEKDLERLLTDQGLARRLGDAGRRTREERFTWTQVVRRVEDVYQALTAPTAPRPT
jgi:glycosyltransferase involved in cell wall biosynthesis